MVLAVIGTAAPGRAQESTAVAPEEVAVEGPGGDPIILDRYDGPGEGRVVVLFHQAGASARGEYGFLVPRLLDLGFDVVTPDLHGGGDDFGAPNRTVMRTPEPDGFTYCQALDDVQAVLDHARAWKPGAALVPWGSSYSGSLVVHAVAENGAGVERLLAFSPASGGPMSDCAAAEALPRVDVPVLIVRPEREAGIPAVRERLEAYRAAGHRTYVSVPGTHGSSTLNPDRVDGDVSETWAVVRRFLLEGR